MAAEVTETKKVTPGGWRCGEQSSSCPKLTTSRERRSRNWPSPAWRTYDGGRHDQGKQSPSPSSGTVSCPPGKRPALHADHRSERDRVPDRILQGTEAEGCRQGKEQSDKFFLRRGIRLSDTKELRKVCILLSQNLTTGLDYFLGLSLFDIIDLCEDLKRDPEGGEQDKAMSDYKVAIKIAGELCRLLSTQSLKGAQSGLESLWRRLEGSVPPPWAPAQRPWVLLPPPGSTPGSSTNRPFAGVRKTVDATEAELQAMSQGIRDMAKEMPTIGDRDRSGGGGCRTAGYPE